MARRKNQAPEPVEVRGLRPDERDADAAAMRGEPQEDDEGPKNVDPESLLDPDEMVKVRVRSGRVLLSRQFTKNEVGERIGSDDTFAELGQVFEMKRGDARKLLNRTFDGYPSHDGQPGKFGGVVRDSPIELVQQLG